jgi:hypothetical protein
MCSSIGKPPEYLPFRACSGRTQNDAHDSRERFVTLFVAFFVSGQKWSRAAQRAGNSMLSSALRILAQRLTAPLEPADRPTRVKSPPGLDEETR